VKLGDVIEGLSFGPAANLALLGEGSGVVPESSHNRLVFLVNQALTALYGRFRLSQKTVTVLAIDCVSTYNLRPEHAQTNGALGYAKYILDTEEDRFLGDVLRVELVSDTCGNEYNINDRKSPCGNILIPSFDQIQIVNPLVGYEYVLEYRANHPKLLTGEDLLEQEVRLPEAYHAALYFHVAGQIYESMNGQDNTLKGQEYKGEYERLCVEHENRNTDAAAQSSTNVRPDINGWC
jgi:hypothetical protein